jgi:hypothetical protein
LSGIISGDGAKALGSYRNVSGRALDVLIHQGRAPAEKQVRDAVDNVDTLIQDITAFKNHHKLDSDLINWILGDWNLLQNMKEKSFILTQDIEEMSLPPSTSPDVLTGFFTFGLHSAALDPQLSAITNLFLNIEERMKKVRIEFEKRLAAP